MFLNSGRGVLMLVLAAGIAATPVAAWAQDSQPPAEAPKRLPRQQKPAQTPPTTPPTTPPATPSTPPATSPPASTPSTPTKAPTTPTKATPTAPPAKVAPKEPKEPGPYVARLRPKDYNIKVYVDVSSDRSDARDQNNMPSISPFDFKTLAMVFPLPPSTAGATPADGTLMGKLTVNDQVVSEKPTLLGRQISGTQYHSGVRLIRMNYDQATTCRQIGLEVGYRTTCFSTEVDEANAVKVDWPKGEWPEVARSTFEPQMFVDYCIVQQGDGVVTENYDPKPIKDWVNQLTKGNPRSAPPYTVAKFLAGAVVGKIQVNGDGLSYLHTSQFQGFNLQGPTATMALSRGSEQDLPPLLVAMYRAAGLPARLVVGFEANSGAGSNSVKEQLGMKRGRGAYRSWVEFCLFDETNNTVNWVPVDVVQLRKRSSRTAPIEKPWDYFGTHKDLNEIVPLSLGFHPPTTVESYGAPAMWGWLMTPSAPHAAYQSIRVDISTASVSGEKPGDPKKDNNKKKDDDKKDKMKGK